MSWWISLPERSSSPDFICSRVTLQAERSDDSLSRRKVRYIQYMLTCSVVSQSDP